MVSIEVEEAARSCWLVNSGGASTMGRDRPTPCLDTSQEPSTDDPPLYRLSPHVRAPRRPGGGAGGGRAGGRCPGARRPALHGQRLAAPGARDRTPPRWPVCPERL